MNYYYLTPEKKPCGPLPLDGMVDMVGRGQLSASVLVAKEGDASWRPLLQVAKEQGLELKVEGAPGACPSCGQVLSVQDDGTLPFSCPRCGRAFRPAPGKENNLWYNFTLAMRQYAKFSGRATRMEYWSFALFCTLICLPLQIILHLAEVYFEQYPVDAMPDVAWWVVLGVVLLCGVLGIALTIPSYAVWVRRLHDVGWSGKWVLAQLGLMALVVVSAIVALGVAITYGDADGLPLASGVCIGIIIISYIGIIGIGILTLVLSFMDSKRGPNKYGPSRKYPLG